MELFSTSCNIICKLPTPKQLCLQSLGKANMILRLLSISGGPSNCSKTLFISVTIYSPSTYIIISWSSSSLLAALIILTHIVANLPAWNSNCGGKKLTGHDLRGQDGCPRAVLAAQGPAHTPDLLGTAALIGEVRRNRFQAYLGPGQLYWNGRSEVSWTVFLGVDFSLVCFQTWPTQCYITS